MMPVLAGDAWGSGLTLDTGEHDDNPGPTRNAVGPAFFETIGISFHAGRSFNSLDTAEGTPVAIVNEAFARRYFPGKSAIGRRIGQGGDQGIARYTIVGVTRDTKVADVRESARPFWYVPLAQLPGFDQVTLHVRTTGAPDDAFDDIRRAIASVDRSVPILEAATMRQQIEDQVQVERLLAILANVFAGVAVLLATLGLYGVMSYMTTAKAREMSIRMALGASPGAMLQLVFGRSAFVIVGGLLAGLGIAVAAGRQVQPLLFELDSADPPTLIGATTIVLLVALAATGLPARRASKTNPADALR
jgi:ABC-type antimicrobial peptide transport system permease subunit